MKRFAPALLTIAALAASAVVLFGQWPKFSSGVPKGKDGEYDFAAPAPKTAKGVPDFTGTWTLKGKGPFGVALKGKEGKGPDGKDKGFKGPEGKGKDFKGKEPPPPADPNSPPVGQFFNIGAGFKDGLPFTPWAKALRAERLGDNAKDNPDAHCLPLGITQLHMHSQPRKIIQTDREIVILYEANANMREIYIDGRPPAPKNADPWWYGYSVGHFEGDTLVVETTGFRDDVWLDVEGSPMTSQGKMIERFRRPDFGNMTIDTTIIDPTSYTEPFTVRVNHRLMPDEELIEFVCEERDATHYVGKDNKK